MKLYKYRPLTDFLFKELYYQELYFSSYLELNDPLDLSARVEFTPENEDQLDFLIQTIVFNTHITRNKVLNGTDKDNNRELFIFYKDDEARSIFKANIFKLIKELRKDKNFISFQDIIDVIGHASKGLKFKINFLEFGKEIDRLTKKFFENSYAACFSETNNDFLMWSHYASKHSGICLEFSLEHSGLFPFKRTNLRTPNNERYLERMSKWSIDETIFWDRINKVNYQHEQPFINFFDFSYVFSKENDVDLMYLSKPWTHEFAYKLERVFSTKTLPWKYENEWRAIEINFGDPKEPEERIMHYPIESLSKIFFGIRTPETIKRRIYKIINRQNKNIQYFDCIPTDGREINFQIWHYYEII